jgi:hypothetical protein
MKIIIEILVFGLFISGLQAKPHEEAKDKSKDEGDKTVESIYKRGTWNFNLNQELNYQTGYFKTFTESYSCFKSQFEINYFLISHFGIGVGISALSDDFNHEDASNIKEWGNHFIGGNINLLFGSRISGAVNLTVIATAGIGDENRSYYYDHNGYNDHYNYSWYKITAGIPLKLDKNVYLTPYAGYEYSVREGEYDVVYRNSWCFDLKFEFNLNHEDIRCDLGKHRVPIDERYQKGEVHLGSIMRGSFRAGHEENLIGSLREEKSFWTMDLSGIALYYVHDNIAIGLSTSFWLDHNDPEETGESDDLQKYQDSELLAGPVIRMHWPFDNMLRNFYGETSIELGKIFRRDIYDDEVYKRRDPAYDIKVGIGYEFYFSEKFSLCPVTGFEYTKIGDSHHDPWHCLYFGVGWNYHLR